MNGWQTFLDFISWRHSSGTVVCHHTTTRNHWDLQLGEELGWCPWYTIQSFPWLRQLARVHHPVPPINHLNQFIVLFRQHFQFLSKWGHVLPQLWQTGAIRWSEVLGYFVHDSGSWSSMGHSNLPFPFESFCFWRFHECQRWAVWFTIRVDLVWSSICDSARWRHVMDLASTPFEFLCCCIMGYWFNEEGSITQITTTQHVQSVDMWDNSSHVIMKYSVNCVKYAQHMKFPSKLKFNGLTFSDTDSQLAPEWWK